MPTLAYISFHKEGHHCCIILTPSRPDSLNIVLATLQTQSQIILDAKQDLDKETDLDKVYSAFAGETAEQNQNQLNGVCQVKP